MQTLFLHGFNLTEFVVQAWHDKVLVIVCKVINSLSGFARSLRSKLLITSAERQDHVTFLATSGD